MSQMVYVFTSTVIEPPAVVFMGANDDENDRLIEFGSSKYIWFHMSGVSSAHVYLSLPNGMDIDTIPQALLDDCCQLVKANSKKGNKMTDASIVYTPWSNLSKTERMAVGEVGFHDENAVKMRKVARRINEVVNRLEKTKMKQIVDYRSVKKQLRNKRDGREQRNG
ncbi:hypothetical protein PMAYCL1PPCAC_26352 [Pristionchus mayeri]|uniref:Coiled-coil domain-containing protein 25 n=1 Tax=Pristionchus mayeri TaxID=1317129 RepID=A0AAN5I848_9BILA|nr:hypothetical protein PMAYCL1PPCAC_26352 [Pristionchus mayeri]